MSIDVHSNLLHEHTANNFTTDTLIHRLKIPQIYDTIKFKTQYTSHRGI